MQPGEFVESVKKEVKTLAFWKEAFAEFLATFFLVSTCINSAVHMGNKQDGSPVLRHALAGGFFVCVLFETFGHLGAGFMNPVFATVFAILGEISILKGAVYVVVEILGGITACFLWEGILTERYSDQIVILEKHIGIGVTDGQAVFVEFIATFLLVWVALGSLDIRYKTPYTAAIIIGFYVAAAIMAFGPYTGCFMNPSFAVGLGALRGGTKQWIWWVGDLLGGVTATLTYEFVFAWEVRKKAKEEKKKQELLGVTAKKRLSVLPFGAGDTRLPEQGINPDLIVDDTAAVKGTPAVLVQKPNGEQLEVIAEHGTAM